jgi:hypothetical protein
MTNDITRVARVSGIYSAGYQSVGFVRGVGFWVRHGITDGER